MRIDKTTPAEELDRIYVSDACFTGFRYDPAARELCFEVADGFDPKTLRFRFHQVALFEMQSCAFWGTSPRAYFWEPDVDENDGIFACSLFRDAGDGEAVFQIPEGYLESVLSLHSGDALTVVCQSIDFEEEPALPASSESLPQAY